MEEGGEDTEDESSFFDGQGGGFAGASSENFLSPDDDEAGEGELFMSVANDEQQSSAWEFVRSFFTGDESEADLVLFEAVAAASDANLSPLEELFKAQSISVERVLDHIELKAEGNEFDVVVRTLCGYLSFSDADDPYNDKLDDAGHGEDEEELDDDDENAGGVGAAPPPLDVYSSLAVTELKNLIRTRNKAAPNKPRKPKDDLPKLRLQGKVADLRDTLREDDRRLAELRSATQAQ